MKMRNAPGRRPETDDMETDDDGNMRSSASRGPERRELNKGTPSTISDQMVFPAANADREHVAL